MKKLITLCLALVFAISLFAQTAMTQLDKVQLNDGSNLVGQIIEQTDEELSFQILGGPLVKIDRDKITSIIQGEDLEDKKGRVYFSNGKSISTKGRYGTLNIGTNWTNSPTVDGNLGGLNLSTSFGYSFNRFLGVGGGFGVDIINGPDFNTFTFIPVFAEIRGYPFNSPRSLYYALNLGYGFAADLFDSFSSQGSYNGGLYAEPRIGLRFASHKRGQFYIEFGYKYQKASADYRRFSSFEGTQFIAQDIQFFRPTFNFGWFF